MNYAGLYWFFCREVSLSRLIGNTFSQKSEHNIHKICEQLLCLAVNLVRNCGVVPFFLLFSCVAFSMLTGKLAEQSNDVAQQSGITAEVVCKIKPNLKRMLRFWNVKPFKAVCCCSLRTGEKEMHQVAMISGLVLLMKSTLVFSRSLSPLRTHLMAFTCCSTVIERPLRPRSWFPTVKQSVEVV